MYDFLMWAGGIIATGVFGLIGWVLKMVFSTLKEHKQYQGILSKEMHEKHNNLSTSLAAHKLHAAETFATKIEVKEGFDKIMNKLDKIDDKLDLKADKQ